MKKYFILFITFLFFGTTYARGGNTPSEIPDVRIAVVKGAANFVIAVNGEYTILNGETMPAVENGIRLKKARVVSSAEGVHIGRRLFKSKRIRITAPDQITIYHKGKVRRYRNRIDIIPQLDNTLLVVNVVDLESYVRGVLFHEISNRWAEQATMAQAVATRSYAMYQLLQNKKKLYDMTDDTFSQVYGGSSAERYRTTIAVDRTEGQVLVYNGKILQAFFHSNSGGHTENVMEVWDGSEAIPPLKGVDSPYSVGQPSYFWKKNFQLKDVQDRLANKGFDVGAIARIEIEERNESGRIRSVLIVGRDGRQTRISGKQFRLIVGPNEIKSNNYAIAMQGYFIDVIGKGWGHGVGMCQWGAHAMADKGHKYDAILKYYYPGVEIKKNWNNP